MSRTGKSRGGYTLLEMVVVMAIIGVVIGVSMPMFSRMDSRVKIFQATQSLIADLRQAHKKAVTEHNDVRVVFYPAENRYRFEDRDHNMVVRMMVALADGVGWVEAEPQALHFYPDGSASPVVITLTSGDLQSTIAVDWLTGQARSGHDS